MIIIFIIPIGNFGIIINLLFKEKELLITINLKNKLKIGFKILKGKIKKSEAAAVIIIRNYLKINEKK